MAILGALGGGLAVFLLLQALAGLVGRERRQVVQRLGSLEQSAAPSREAELDSPFAQRVLFPGLRRLGALANRLTPGGYHAQLQRRLVLAGHPWGLGPREFIGLQALCTMAGLALGLPLLALGPRGFLGTLAFALVGAALPALSLHLAVGRRGSQALRELPDVLDLLTISVEAGLGFDAALARVVEKMGGVLGGEFARVLNEVRLGKVRREALRDMARRLEVDDLRTFIGAVVQAEQLGVSIAPVLRVQSQAMRLRRRQRAQEQAMKAPVKMLFPLVFFVFPGLFVIILGPAMIQILEFFISP